MANKQLKISDLNSGFSNLEILNASHLHHVTGGCTTHHQHGDNEWDVDNTPHYEDDGDVQC